MIVMRQTKLSVTLFLQYRDQYLFLHRSPDRDVDPNRLNGIGGKVEPGEDFVTAAIRETEEESGILVNKQDIEFAGFTHLREGYPDDWLAAFFIVHLHQPTLPIDPHTREGELIWIQQNEVLQTSYELVDDLRYIWPLILKNEFPFFLAATVNGQEKIVEHSLSIL